MKVKELIARLKEYNQEARVNVIAHNVSHNFSLTYGVGDGGTKEKCFEVSFYVDKLCDSMESEA